MKLIMKNLLIFILFSLLACKKDKEDTVMNVCVAKFLICDLSDNNRLDISNTSCNRNPPFTLDECFLYSEFHK